MLHLSLYREKDLNKQKETKMKRTYSKRWFNSV